MTRIYTTVVRISHLKYNVRNNSQEWGRGPVPIFFNLAPDIEKYHNRTELIIGPRNVFTSLYHNSIVTHDHWLQLDNDWVLQGQRSAAPVMLSSSATIG